MNAPSTIRLSEPVDTEGRVIAAIGSIVAQADAPKAAACAFIRLASNALRHQFTRSWEGHDAAARELERQATWHREQSRRLMPIARRSR